jgi:hypothetical protein
MSNPPPVPQFGLAIDWETSGYTVPNYAAEHQGLSFGACVFEVKTLDIVDSLYCEIQHDPKYKWEDSAEKVHGMSREYLAANGVPMQVAAVKLGNLVIKYFGTEKILLMGHRLHFDKAFTEQLTGSIDIKLDWNPIGIDSAAIGMSLIGIERSEELFRYCGLPPRTEHNALEDIVYTVMAMQHLKSVFNLGLAQLGK